eukprot:TRINITY_DN57155_c0_g1_i1.p2 TRINITY_DN57155_c0_g1~~TRINITY_DN57155_c0_g1_i1.p2  ORF type:complete len:168 (-),score=29.01 TRINITY_DN57155_c0_g1_i1:78-581(-)
MPSGTVKMWNDDRGFGFIAAADGSSDVFVHRSVLQNGSEMLSEGEVVQFETQWDERKGKMTVTTCTGGSPKGAAKGSGKTDGWNSGGGKSYGLNNGYSKGGGWDTGGYGGFGGGCGKGGGWSNGGYGMANGMKGARSAPYGNWMNGGSPVPWGKGGGYGGCRDFQNW